MTQTSDIKDLLQKHILNTASLQEQEQLFNALEQDDYNEEDMLQMLDGMMGNSGEPYSVYNRERWKPVVNEIILKCKTRKETASSVKRLRWIRIAAAAVILILSGTGIYRWLSLSSETASTNINRPVQSDVYPGGHKAILTLSDGSSIILDTAPIGNLVQQGNTKIIKLDNGRLAYDVTGKAENRSGSVSTGELLYNTISTPRGGQYQIVLPDGSKVWLNAASSIKFPSVFAEKERSVEVSGEAYFEIASHKNHPFYVKTGDVGIQVLGTDFNVNAYKDEATIKTTLVEGSIRVGVESALNVKQSVILKPGQQAQISNEGGIKVDNVDIEQAIAWKKGLFKFNKTSLEDVLKQISRWYDVDITYKGNVPSIKFEGEMNRDLKLSQVLEILGIMDVHFSIQGKKLIVMP